MVNLEAAAPSTYRQPVLLFEPVEVVEVLLTHPDTWYVIAEGPIERRGTFSQTAHRIRVGKIAAFDIPGGQGFFETTVEATVDPKTGDKTGAKLFARWVADPPADTPKKLAPAVAAPEA